VLNAIGAPMAPEQGEAIDRHLDHVCEALAPWSAGGSYFNFAERPTRFEDLFAEETGRRLSTIKAEWDPDGIIRSNHAIPAVA